MKMVRCDRCGAETSEQGARDADWCIEPTPTHWVHRENHCLRCSPAYGFDFHPEFYETVRRAAQRHANLTGADFGVAESSLGGGLPRVEAPGMARRWSYWRLPLPGNRFGLDANCEVVRPEVES